MIEVIMWPFHLLLRALIPIVGVDAGFLLTISLVLYALFELRGGGKDGVIIVTVAVVCCVIAFGIGFSR